MEPSGVLRRAGAGDAPNVALGPLKWNVAKIRKGVDDRLAAIDDRRRAAAAERSSAHALLRGRLDARHQRERSTLKLASQPSQPKKIAALQASALNLRRHGRVEDARRKEKEATELGDVHWRTTAGKAFERSVLADVAKLEASFSMSDGADDAVLDRERLGILRKLDAAVASTRRENGRSHNILTWKGYHHAANGDLVKLQGVVERLGIEVVLLQKDPDTQWNALFFGAWADKVQIVHFLLDRGAAKLDHADPEGRTVLHVAAAFGSREVCAALIERGADMDCRNKKGETTLQIAQRMRRPQALLDYLGKFIRVPKARAEEFEKERLLERPTPTTTTPTTSACRPRQT
ncbi:hypothetical protein M885DRAFT_17460 [Pelagophyceae sp. CCMP2097]|nr:hypothetical protein M885DRAFT_17460 [Pelagophyceae sp. CCMP2097]